MKLKEVIQAIKIIKTLPIPKRTHWKIIYQTIIKYLSNMYQGCMVFI